jgi:hypothetical protein
VPTNRSGFSVSKKLDKLGHRSSDTGILAFDDVRVPEANRIGPEGMGFILQMRQFQRERLAGTLMGVSGMEKIIRQTITYCRERETFGQPLIDNQYVHFRIAELLTEVEALRQFAYHSVRLYVAGEDVTKEVSMAKLKGDASPAKWPIAACNSTAAWATWRNIRWLAISATPASCPSAAAPMKSCWASSPSMKIFCRVGRNDA